MYGRMTSFFILFIAGLCNGQSIRTENFIIIGPDINSSKEIGQLAETKRKDLSKEWLGTEMPKWNNPCYIKMNFSNTQKEGFTRFEFNAINIEMIASKDVITKCILPHEITHTILMYYFKQTPPRWLDEGCSIQSEDKEFQKNLDNLCIKYLNNGEGIALSHLFKMKEYPTEKGLLYAQGGSIIRYLLTQGNKKKILEFGWDGMTNWDDSVKRHYKFKDVDELQSKWLEYLKEKGKK